MTTAGQRDNRERRRKALIAAICGGALLLGGSTFALWTTSEKIGNQSISAGDFALEVDKTAVAAWDISGDRTGGTEIEVAWGTVIGHAVTKDELKGFGLVPGDTVLVKYPVTVTLSGDNLVAKLAADFSGGVDGANALPKGVTATFKAYNNTTKVGEASVTAGGVENLGYFASQNATAADGEDAVADEVTKLTGKTLSLNVYVTIAWANGTDETEGVGGKVNLEGAEFKLSQARDIGKGDFVATPTANPGS
jgi:alternate signal-mediated exported protein